MRIELLINNLPDDCLLSIFQSLDSLEDLMNCYKVCEKWKYVVAICLRRVRYLNGSEFIGPGPYYEPKVLNFTKAETLIEVHNKDLIPNVKIINIVRCVEIKRVYQLIANSESTKGAIENMACDCQQLDVIQNIEMIALQQLKPYIFINGSSLKQLYLMECRMRDLGDIGHRFPNLERLHILNRDNTEKYGRYEGKILSKLKIFEYSSSNGSSIDGSIFTIIDSCPKLTSAFIRIRCKMFAFETTRKHNLEDLVLDFITPDFGAEWNELKKVFGKFPLLKHLAIRNYNLIKDEHVAELVSLLPKLVLLDLRGCSGITHILSDHVRCANQGRSIKLYHDEKDCTDRHRSIFWTEIISSGFDFMKNCFFRNFWELPYLLDPIDDN